MVYNREEYIGKIKSVESTLRNRFGVIKVILFGSVARGEHTPESDIDLCVETTSPNPILLMGLKEYVTSLVGCTVDVVRRHRNMNPYLQAEIQNDGIQVF